MASVKKTKKAKTKVKAKKAKSVSKAVKKSAAAPSAGAVPCTCIKFGKFYYCMVQRPDGSFERCPTLARFRTLAECQQHSC